MSISMIAGLKWADRYDLAQADRSRVVLIMHLLERSTGPAAALLVGRRQVERLAPPPPPPVRRPRPSDPDETQERDGGDPSGSPATGSAPRSSAKTKKRS